MRLLELPPGSRHHRAAWLPPRRRSPFSRRTPGPDARPAPGTENDQVKLRPCLIWDAYIRSKGLQDPAADIDGAVAACGHSDSEALFFPDKNRRSYVQLQMEWNGM